MSYVAENLYYSNTKVKPVKQDKHANVIRTQVQKSCESICTYKLIVKLIF